MTPTWEVRQGHVVELLRTIPAESVQCVITSPPYWNLRDYKVVGQIGLEKTPEEYVAKLVEVFNEVKRVLRTDGCLFLNMGDAYFGSGKGSTKHGTVAGYKQSTNAGSLTGQPWDGQPHPILKPKDLIGLPWRVAFALQQPYETHCIKLERDRAWLAAFIDGEGCISIRRHDSNSNAEGHPRCQDGFIPFICATNNDMALLEYAKLITGKGSVLLKQRAGSTDKRQIVSRHDSYGWRVESRASIEVVCDIYPFLIAKRKQAILAYTLQQSNLHGKSLRGNGPLPHSEQEKRELLKRLINDCNQRKQVDMPSWCLEPKTQVEPGWWLRSDIIWHKPNPMPESVTDRPTKAHEYLFLLTKSAQYYYDQEAVREPTLPDSLERAKYGWHGHMEFEQDGTESKFRSQSDHVNQMGERWCPSSGRNLRTVWTIPTHGFPNVHFATYPEKLVEPCIRAGTSEKGCCVACGAPWEREVEKHFQAGTKCLRTDIGGGQRRGFAASGIRGHNEPTTTGWHPTCSCHAETHPCLVLDPFCGSGTTGVVALKLQRSFIGLELRLAYVEMSKRRIGSVMPLFEGGP